MTDQPPLSWNFQDSGQDLFQRREHRHGGSALDRATRRGDHPGVRRVHCIVSGVVQGVGFRWSTQREAVRLGAVGWVRNRPDDTVEVLAEGEEAVLVALVEWLQRGPRGARVDGVQVEWGEGEGAFAGFAIRK
jgi:acylphosphatase